MLPPPIGTATAPPLAVGRAALPAAVCRRNGRRLAGRTMVRGSRSPSGGAPVPEFARTPVPTGGGNALAPTMNAQAAASEPRSISTRSAAARPAIGCAAVHRLPKRRSPARLSAVPRSIGTRSAAARPAIGCARRPRPRSASGAHTISLRQRIPYADRVSRRPGPAGFSSRQSQAFGLVCCRSWSAIQLERCAGGFRSIYSIVATTESEGNFDERLALLPRRVNAAAS
jgi:hypothetical protein